MINLEYMTMMIEERRIQVQMGKLIEVKITTKLNNSTGGNWFPSKIALSQLTNL